MSTKRQILTINTESGSYYDETAISTEISDLKNLTGREAVELIVELLQNPNLSKERNYWSTIAAYIKTNVPDNMRSIIGDALGLVPPIKVNEAELVNPTGAVYMHMANGMRRIDTSNSSDLAYMERFGAQYAKEPLFLCEVKLKSSHPIAKAVKAAKAKKEKQKAKIAAARKAKAIEKAKKVLEKAGIKSE